MLNRSTLIFRTIMSSPAVVAAVSTIVSGIIVWDYSYLNTVIEFIVLVPSLVPGSATVHETQIRPDPDDIIKVEIQC
jgi:hypothetical protein